MLSDQWRTILALEAATGSVSQDLVVVENGVANGGLSVAGREGALVPCVVHHLDLEYRAPI